MCGKRTAEIATYAAILANYTAEWHYKRRDARMCLITRSFRHEETLKRKIIRC